MSLSSLAGIIGPSLFAGTFALFVSDHAPVELPGAPFLLASLLLVVALVLATASQRRWSFEAGAAAAPSH